MFMVTDFVWVNTGLSYTTGLSNFPTTSRAPGTYACRKKEKNKTMAKYVSQVGANSNFVCVVTFLTLWNKLLVHEES